MRSKNLRISILKSWVSRSPEGRLKLTARYKTKTSKENMDKRKFNSGTLNNKGGGRKPKIDELAFLEKLDNIIDSDSALLKIEKSNRER